jgi:hypothetical protein
MPRCAIASMIGSLAGSVVLTSTVVAQRVVSSVDVSGTSVWYADTIRSSGGSISPALRVDWSHATLGAYADVSRLGHGSLSAQSVVSPSIFSPSVGSFTGELGGSLGGSTHQDGTRTGQMLGVARLHLMRAGAGAWLGGGAGRTWDGSVWRGMRQGEAGVWVENGGATTLATVTPVVLGDTIRYTDFQAALRYPVSSYEVGVSAGTRSGSVGPEVGGTSRTWGSVSVVAWLTSRLALVANAGAYPTDLTQGYPGGRFATVALRIASRDERSVERAVIHTSTVAPADLSPVAKAVNETRDAGVTSLEVRTVGGTQRVLRIYAPSARAVEINGDFTHWQAVPLARGSDGWWSITRTMAPGTYQMNVRIDGGRWLAPPGLLTTSDEFGGTIGILTIE